MADRTVRIAGLSLPAAAVDQLVPRHAAGVVQPVSVSLQPEAIPSLHKRQDTCVPQVPLSFSRDYS